MANVNCNGTLFKTITRSGQLYQCFWDSKVVMLGPNRKECPNCRRLIDAKDAGTCKTVMVEFAILPDQPQTKVELPPPVA